MTIQQPSEALRKKSGERFLLLFGISFVLASQIRGGGYDKLYRSRSDDIGSSSDDEVALAPSFGLQICRLYYFITGQEDPECLETEHTPAGQKPAAEEPC